MSQIHSPKTLQYLRGLGWASGSAVAALGERGSFLGGGSLVVFSSLVMAW